MHSLNKLSSGTSSSRLSVVRQRLTVAALLASSLLVGCAKKSEVIVKSQPKTPVVHKNIAPELTTPPDQNNESVSSILYEIVNNIATEIGGDDVMKDAGNQVVEATVEYLAYEVDQNSEHIAQALLQATGYVLEESGKALLQEATGATDEEMAAAEAAIEQKQVLAQGE